MKISNSSKWAFALLSLLVPPIGLAGQDTPYTNFGSFLFKLPNGWNPAEKEDAMLLIAPAPRLGSVTSIRLAASDIDVDLQKSFNEFWIGFRTYYRVVRGGHIARTSSNKGYDAYFTTVVAADKGGKQWNVYLASVQYENRFETIMFWSDPSPDATYDKHLDKFLTFLDDLSLADPLLGSHIQFRRRSSRHTNFCGAEGPRKRPNV